MTSPTIARRLAMASAILFVLSLVTGLVASWGLTGMISADGQILLGAHVTAITQLLTMVAVAYTLPMLNYSEVGRNRLAWGFIFLSYANWAISTGKAFLKVHGIGFDQNAANNFVFVLLILFVGIPGFIVGVAWILGLRER